MYIFELIAKWRQKNKTQDQPPAPSELMGGEDELEDPLECEHLFVAIDSTKEVFACSKCGYLIKGKPKAKSILDKNPFIEPQ